MNDIERELRIKFGLFPKLGIKTLQEILDRFDSLQEFVCACRSGKVRDLNNNILLEFVGKVDVIDTQKIERYIAKNKFDLIVYGDEAYPQNLASIYSPPIYFFSNGRYDWRKFNKKKKIGVVGTRRFSDYGKQMTEKIVSELVEAGFIVVSGLAYGIDSIAHCQAIESNGETIAVLAADPSISSPKGNKMLFDQILDNDGAVISELPFVKKLGPEAFPRRNRIIAGLVDAVLVVEAGQKSGALITAEFGFSEGRHVFAIPSDVHKYRKQGANNLIRKNKAVLVTSARDILEEMGLVLGECFVGQSKSSENPVFKNLDESALQILEYLKSGPKTMDQLIGKFDIGYGVLLASLTELEMKHCIFLQEDGRYFYIY